MSKQKGKEFKVDPLFLEICKSFNLPVFKDDNLLIENEEQYKMVKKDLIDNKTKGVQIRAIVSGKPKLLQLTPDECKKLCNKANIEYLDGYETRVTQHIITNEIADRYGDIVRAKGVDFKTNYFPNNPVILYSHQYGNPMIGNSLHLEVDKELKALIAHGLFMDDRIDKTGWADVIFRMVSSGFMRACSIGFRGVLINDPKTEEERNELGLGRWGVEFVKSELMEWSPCNIPANPQALEKCFEEVVKSDEDKNELKERFPQETIDKMFSLKVFEDENCLDMFKEKLNFSEKLIDIPKINLDVKIDQEESTFTAMKILIDKYPKCKELLLKDWGFKESKDGLIETRTIKQTTPEGNVLELEVHVKDNASKKLLEIADKMKDISPFSINLDIGDLVKSVEEIKTVYNELLISIKEFKDTFEKGLEKINSPHKEAEHDNSETISEEDLYPLKQIEISLDKEEN